MKYAIFSDIHGNLPALEASLADAETHGAMQYLFLGDYFRDLPWVNETMELLRGLKNAVIIRGNNENRLLRSDKEKQTALDFEQFGLDKWNYKNISSENVEYLKNLPETAVIEDNGYKIHLVHSSDIFFRKPKNLIFHTSYFRFLLETKPFDRKDYLAMARNALLTRPDVMADICALPEGIYLNGHNHIQFHMEYENKLFINPGSCGMAVDGEITAAYTILTCTANGWNMEERRVIYDVEKALAQLMNSSLSTEAPVWAVAIERSLRFGKDYMSPLLYHVMETAQKYGETSMPVSDTVWRVAVETWDMDKPISEEFFK